MQHGRQLLKKCIKLPRVRNSQQVRTQCSGNTQPDGEGNVTDVDFEEVKDEKK